MRPRVTEQARILDAARRCIGERGFLGASVDDIAAAAGVSRATVYRYGGGKRALIRDVLISECASVIDGVAGAIDAADDGQEAVRALIATAVESVGGNAVLGRAVGPDLRSILPELTVDGAALVARCTSLLVPVLERAADRGLIDPEGPIAGHAEEVVRFVFGVIHTPMLGVAGRDPDAAADRGLRLFGPALRVREPNPKRARASRDHAVS